MKRFFRYLFLILLTLLVIVGAWALYHMRDRFPDYEVNLAIKGAEPAPIQVGFAKASITPEIPDSWTDVNGDAAFNPDDGDTYEDRNRNGHFDTQWIAGFGSRRAAQGVHDSLWARAVVIDDGQTRMAIVAIDAVGFGHDDVIRVRERIPEIAGITYTTVSSTHVHQAPDLVGMWGSSYLSSGVDPDYMELVISQTAKAVEEAVKAIEPASLHISQDRYGAKELLKDTRDPQVYDPGLRMVQVVGKETDKTLGTLLFWADHPETVWSDNLLISSDFPHYFREGVEKGLWEGDSLMMPGVGGIAVYLNGAIGGLMTTHPTTPIPDPFADTVYLEPSFAKAEAQGEQLALLALTAMRGDSVEMLEEGSLSLHAKTIDIPLDNQLFRLASAIGVFDRGMPKWMHLRSELAAWSLGPISCLQMPGEVYPEIIKGGIEAPEGRDFPIDPVEVPPLETYMPGRYPLVIGLANDLIGYIIPKSEWDEEPPYLYGSAHDHYGEVNSVGPETAPLLYQEARHLLEHLPDAPTSERP